MKNWTIGRRITASTGLLLLLLLTVGGIGINALSQVKTLAKNRLRDDAIPGINAMSDIISGVFRGQLAALMAGNAADEKELAQYTEASTQASANINAALKVYEDSITSEEDRRNFDQLVKLRATYLAARQHYLDLIKNHQIDAANAYASTDLEAAFAPYRDHARTMLKWNQDIAVAATGGLIDSAERAQSLTSLVALGSLVAGIVFAWFSIRGINRILQRLSGHLDDSAAQVASAAGQVSSSSQSLAEGSSEQAASLEETSSSLEELTSMTKRNADSAGSAKQLSGETRSAAEHGNTDMTEMRAAMDAIKTSSNDIAKIIKSIDEIAFQTNILALNAAVEAARAGEAGMGFAVVAEEVRALAQRSAASAKETASKIEVAIHNGEHGAQISEKVATSLSLIVEKARRVDELIAEIATASHEQTQGIGQINSAISQMDKVTQSNAGNAEETAAAAEELNAQSVSLKESIADLRRLVGGQSQSTAATREQAPGKPPGQTLRPVSAPARAATPVPTSRLRVPLLQPAGTKTQQDFFRDS